MQIRGERKWRGGKISAHEFRGGQILSTRDFQICTAPSPAVNNDCSLMKKILKLFFHFECFLNFIFPGRGLLNIIFFLENALERLFPNFIQARAVDNYSQYPIICWFLGFIRLISELKLFFASFTSGG